MAELPWKDLSAHVAPIETHLYETQTVRGLDAFRDWDRRLGGWLIYRSLRARVLLKFPTLSAERRDEIGPGNQVHQEIRDLGAGRYSVWHGYLRFSASDNSSPLTNGRRYELFVPFVPSDQLAAVAAWIRRLALLTFGFTLLRVMAEWPRAGRLLANTLPGLFVTSVLITLGAAGAEWYFRASDAVFTEVAWPTTFDPVAGYLFIPNSVVRWTNDIDFWTTERANSLGFLDHEPEIPKPAGRFRVLLVGDSFVEAAQVTNDNKVQTLLARRLTARLGAGRADVVAFGRSGTGPATQLGYYERFGPQVTPDLVILLVVSNDFADSSPLLDAIRNGWHPEHPARSYFERDGEGFRRIPVDPDWMTHRPVGNDPIARYATFKADPAFGPRLDGWGGPEDEDIDAMFFRRALPPIFEDAIAVTGRAFQEWKALGERDGFRVLVVGAENLTRDSTDDVRDGTLYMQRMRDAVTRAGLPFLDLHPFFAGQPDPKAAVWSHDSHWTEVGHQWAEQAIGTYLMEHGLVPEAGAGGGR